MNKPLVSCPNCGQPNTWSQDNTFKPFCSERCKLIDLGQWASEAHRIAGEEANAANSAENENDLEKD